MKFLIKLYPARWRHRYAKELEALLEDSGSRDAWDLFRGAMEIQMKTWSFGRVVTLCGIAGVVFAAAVAFSMPYRYQSTATLKIVPDLDGLTSVTDAAFTPQALSDIIRRERLYAGAPPDDGIDLMRRAIRIEPAAPSLVRVSFAGEDPVQAQRVSQELVGRIVTANLNPSANPNGLTVQLVIPADLPKKQFERKRYGLAGLGLPVGLVLGVGLALLLRRRAPAP